VTDDIIENELTSVVWPETQSNE